MSKLPQQKETSSYASKAKTKSRKVLARRTEEISHEKECFIFILFQTYKILLMDYLIVRINSENNNNKNINLGTKFKM